MVLVFTIMGVITVVVTLMAYPAMPKITRMEGARTRSRQLDERERQLDVNAHMARARVHDNWLCAATERERKLWDDRAQADYGCAARDLFRDSPGEK